MSGRLRAALFLRLIGSYTPLMPERTPPPDRLEALCPPELRDRLACLYAESQLFRHLLEGLDEESLKALLQPRDRARLPDGGKAWLPPAGNGNIEECMKALRLAKRRGLAHAIWWELGIGGDIEASWTAWSAFADGLLRRALDNAARLIRPRWGAIEGGRFAVIGLGKLGGSELNLGSDVDLMFVFDATPGARSSGGWREAPAAEYYGHLARMFIRLIDERTGDGQVWPVDMRLRPGGASAAICLSLAATLDFYRDYGQTWERAMLIKARPVAGDGELGRAFLDGIEPFIYRRHLDYTTVAALAEMKRRIDAQAGGVELGEGFDVKRGSGGIREIEFVVQTMQLVFGGRRPEVRARASLAALDALARAGLLPRDDAEGLADAYRLLRRVEHAVQARRGEQTHRLPPDWSSYLAAVLELENPDEALAAPMARVRASFERLVIGGQRAETVHDWLSAREEMLAPWPEEQRRRGVRALERIERHLERGLLPERARMQVGRFLEHAMPRWLDDVNGPDALDAFAELVHAIGGRATYLDLLAHHAGARDWLVGALAASGFVREHLARDPSLLEWPLEGGADATDIENIVRGIASMSGEPLEEALRGVGRLVDRARLHCALAVDAHQRDPVTIGRWLADVADAATECVRRLALREMGLDESFPLVALAMGKHGSREMGLASDLDMVFVLVAEDPTEPLGSRSIGECAQRLGRRMIRMLSDRPPFGAGFEFDSRLRPSGSSGVLVTTLAGFEDYQRHHAQTWEHQALCRARPCAGPQKQRERVAEAVRSILAMPRDLGELAREIDAMREKMRRHLASRSPEIINLKQDPGGLVDIEFLAQFARLAFGGEDTATPAMLKAGESKLPVELGAQVDALIAAWREYRWIEHVLTVELAVGCEKIPADPGSPVWKTFRRHTRIRGPSELSARMDEVHAIYRNWMAHYQT